MATAIVLLSGGLDSTVAAASAKADGFRLCALSIDYGQRHRIELERAAAVARALGVERHVLLPLDLAAFGGSALTDPGIAVPKDAPGAPVPPAATIPVTYVPARNTVLLSLALAFAEVEDARDIFIGVNALDYSGYPDCRPDFIALFERLAGLATRAGVEGRPCRVRTPLLRMHKADIVREGLRLAAPLHLTWSCYDPQPGGPQPGGPQPGGRPCGGCESCRLRARGFAEAGLADPALA